MVKVTTNYLIRKMTYGRQSLVRHKDETEKQFLNRLTHLRLQEQFIDAIADNILDCQSVSVMYLQNNMLKSIHNLHNFPSLTHLYLQRNSLTKIENLEGLTNLRKIYLGYNAIGVLEGLGETSPITEIHIEFQNLPLGDTIYCEPRTLQNLQATLQVLNVTGNNLTTLKGFCLLTCLVLLNAAENKISDLYDVTDSLTYWPNLKNLELTQNTVTRDKRYKDQVIIASKSLEILDGKEIHPNTRKYLEKITEIRSSRIKRSDSDQKSNFQARVTFNAPETKQSDKTSASNFGDIFPNSPVTNDFDYINSSLFPAWKLRTNINAANPSFLPRAYWKSKHMGPSGPKFNNSVNFLDNAFQSFFKFQ